MVPSVGARRCQDAAGKEGKALSQRNIAPNGTDRHAQAPRRLPARSTRRRSRLKCYRTSPARRGSKRSTPFAALWQRSEGRGSLRE